MRIRARLYSSTKTKPIQIAVPTRCTLPPREAGPRFPYAESILADAKTQPYIHDCMVILREGKSTYRFRVFFKRHCRLKKNRSFRPLQGITPICSDMFVMRIAAANTSSVVNMRDRDTILADYMIPRWRVSVLNVGDIFWLNLCRHRFAHTISRFKSGRRLPTLLKFRRSLGIRRR